MKKIFKTFKFGIITDTHIRSPEGDQSSPYPVNEKANDRARYAVQLLADQNPDFVIHLGDMVHPLPPYGRLFSRRKRGEENIFASDAQYEVCAREP